MNRIVYSVFKTIMFAIIFVFVFDIVFYMYRVTTLNQRMESISTSLKKVVMDNNYLPSETAKMYTGLLGQMICDYNGVSYHTGMSGNDFLNTVASNNFIAGFKWNYDSDAVNTGLSLTAQRKYYSSGSWHTVTENIVNKRMDTPGDYGDVCIVQLSVEVYQPMWGWTSGTSVTGNSDGSWNNNHSADGQVTGDYNYNGTSGLNWTRNATFRTQTFSYTYYVPCLNYKTVTQ